LNGILELALGCMHGFYTNKNSEVKFFILSHNDNTEPPRFHEKTP